MQARLSILALLICAVGAPEASADPAEGLFDPGAVTEIDLTLPQESKDALAADPGEYVDGTFTLKAGEVTYGPLDVGVRLKGGIGSFRTLAGKAAFKVKFGHSVSGQRLLGLKTLTLNNMVQDRSMVHELLTYEAFRASGLPAPRTGYAYVRVNGEDYGVYLNVETLDSVSLPRWFATTGHLYEGEYGTDVAPGRAGDFEVDEGSKSDRGDLEALIAAAATPGQAWAQAVGEVADLRQMTRMWALEKYAGHWDGYAGGRPNSRPPNNYYLHSDADGRFQMIPWGTDQTWVRRVGFGSEGGLLFRRCLGHGGCAALYRASLREAAETMAGLDLDSLADETAEMLRPWQAQDPRREYSLEAIDAAVTAIRRFLALRGGDVAAYLRPPAAARAPSQPGPPRSPVRPPALRVGLPRMAGRTIVTSVRLPSAGRVGQRAVARLGKRRRGVCRARATRGRAGAVTLRCRLSARARRVLLARRLRLVVRTRYFPAGAATGALTRRSIIAPRTPAPLRARAGARG